MKAWLTLARPDFALRWRYPALTPLGHPVEVVEAAHDEMARLHLLSRGSAEVYFEVRRLPALPPADAYTRHAADLAQRFAADDFALTALMPATLAGLPAHAYAFRWQQNERAALLLPQGGTLYRLIYDPRSPLNTEILATVALNP